MEREKKDFLNIAPNDIESIFLRIASPEEILSWSYGEVLSPDTINYRTQRSEKKGLFDEKIFGTEKDFECNCGKYKGVRFKGVICDRCGVEITKSIVRRERMGHIELATPVAHPWFVRKVSSKLALFLNLNKLDLIKVIDFVNYIILDFDEAKKKEILKSIEKEYSTKIKLITNKEEINRIKENYQKSIKEVENIEIAYIFDEIVYQTLLVKYPTFFNVGIGSEAIYKLCQSIDLKKYLNNLEKSYETTSSLNRPKLVKRIGLVKSLINNNIKPEWMFLIYLPVVPPMIRPIISLGGGKTASSDLNDLYRRVINRNNRLKKLMQIQTPDIILRNEKRILQEAVDALIDNTIKTNKNLFSPKDNQKELKSIYETLVGKENLIRGSILAKRIDYSARSVVVIGPELKINEVGLPKHMTLEIFKPFVIAEILEREITFNIKSANRLIDDRDEVIWEILENVIEGKYVLINRPPTLHRLNIQAFKPKLIEGKAIRLHPLICAAFNADFDGDTFTIAPVLTQEANLEAKEILCSNKNLLKPGTGEFIMGVEKDMILGCNWATKIIDGKKGEGKYFQGSNEAILAYEYGLIDIQSKIKVMKTSSPKYTDLDLVFETSVGRLLFNSVLPSEYKYINYTINSKNISKLENDFLQICSLDEITEILDRIKNFSFKFVTKSGLTWGINTVKNIDNKEEIIKRYQDEVYELNNSYDLGLMTEEERYKKIIGKWYECIAEIEKNVACKSITENGSADFIINSGARGKIAQVNQIVGVKGLMQNTSGKIIETPILSSYNNGLNPIEYFISTHGTKKGVTDTALKTSKSGYLTRRLFYACHDLIITSADCGTKKHIIINKKELDILDSFSYSIEGRILAEDLEISKKEIYPKGHFITKVDSLNFESNPNINTISIRSPLTCNIKGGLCQKCYGRDLSSIDLIDIGEPVGAIAAHSVSEPSTQLTMRTFHSGGVSKLGGDIIQGLPRLEQIFERTKPNSPAILSKVDGLIVEVKKEGRGFFIKIEPKNDSRSTKSTSEYIIPPIRTIIVKKNQEVVKGQFLTDGSADLNQLFDLVGKEATQRYMIDEVKSIFNKAAKLSPKHLEVIIRQMTSRVKVKSPGGSDLLEGKLISNNKLYILNKELKKQEKELIKAEDVLLGIKAISMSSDSFLSTISHERISDTLIRSSLEPVTDNLESVASSIYLGRLINVGTGYSGSRKHKMMEKLLKEKETDEED